VMHCGPKSAIVYVIFANRRAMDEHFVAAR